MPVPSHGRSRAAGHSLNARSTQRACPCADTELNRKVVKKLLKRLSILAAMAAFICATELRRQPPCAIAIPLRNGDIRHVQTAPVRRHWHGVQGSLQVPHPYTLHRAFCVGGVEPAGCTARCTPRIIECRPEPTHSKQLLLPYSESTKTQLCISIFLLTKIHIKSWTWHLLQRRPGTQDTPIP